MRIPPAEIGNGYYGYENNFSLEVMYMDNRIEQNDPPSPNNDFSEYMWMENEEEFDKEVLQQLQEEELMEECLEAMLEEENDRVTNAGSTNCTEATSSEDNNFELCDQLNSLRVHDVAKQSNLNPNAAEFVPSFKSQGAPEISAKSS